MPTLSTSKWPQPKSNDEWEDMVLDAMRIHWNDQNAYRFGRNGQSQHGVDVLGMRGLLNVGAQAKNCDSLSKQNIEAEIKKTELLHVQLSEMYFVISGKRDMKLQKLIYNISEENKEKGSFNILVLFFEDVCDLLSQRKDLIIKYWQSFLNEVRKIFENPVLSTEDALDIIVNLNEYRVLEDQIKKASSGTVGLCFRIESAPNLQAKMGSMERCWQIAMSENHETHIVTLWRFAINVDDGSMFFLDIVHGEWITLDQWKNRLI